MAESFGEYIRNLRNGHGYTLTQLAAKLGIDSSALSKIETNKKNFDAKLLGTLSEIFSLDERTLKNEFYSETVAKILFDNHCSEEVLSIAATKINLLKNKNIKQSSLNFK
ncbi:MAG: helix-turn-helix transcriptional regulator [Bacteroidetes bacterium]|nr:helix-turn-helix transcriptional regulator [Bacteroidota bacterium]